MENLQSRKFTVIDEGFICVVCGAQIPPLGHTARNHCNRCLCSLHLDENPGDRLCQCKGVLRPDSVQTGKKGLQIIHKCEKCGAIKKNIAADDDDYDLIVALSAKGVYNTVNELL
jgi:hypothetical protein